MESVCKLLALNKLGILPFDGETRKEFLSRADSLLQNKSKQNQTEPFFNLAKEEYDIFPSWVKIVFDKKEVGRFHLAATIYKKTKRWGYLVDFIALQPAWKEEVFYRKYSKQEVLSHEALHILRAGNLFSSYDEILAYQSQKNGFRRFFGEVFGEEKSVIITLALSFVLLLISFFSLGFFFLFFLLYMGWIFFLFFLLFLKKKILKAALKRIKKIASRNTAKFVLCRMTEKEIKMFSKKSEKECLEYVLKKTRTSLRWLVIYKSYFGPEGCKNV